MDFLPENEVLSVEENSVKVQNQEWNRSRTPDRRYADALLSISEEGFAKDEDAYELTTQSGWEEAVQGWGRSPPLACLHQTQKKNKKSKAAGSDYHCLLCTDMKLLKQAQPANSPPSILKAERNCTLDKQHLWKGSKSAHLCLTRLSRANPSNGYASAAEHHDFRDAMKQAACGDRAFLKVNQLTLAETFPDSENTRAADKERAKTAERDPNVFTIINSFSILPPVRPGGGSDPNTPDLMNSTSSSDEGESQEVLGAGEQGAIVKMCEFIKQAGVDSDVPGVRDGAFSLEHQGLSGLHWPPQPNKHLRSPQGIQNSKRHDPPLKFVGDLFPRNAYRLVRNIKHEDLGKVSVKNNHAHRLYLALKSKSITDTNSPLPALFGTRVPLPATSHRLL